MSPELVYISSIFYSMELHYFGPLWWRNSILSSRLLSKNLKIKIYRTIILPVVLYGYETWSLTLKEEHGLRVFENRVLRRVFGPKRER